MSTLLQVPFGVDRLATAAPTTEDAPHYVITYSEALQMNVTQSGNPWHAISAELPETQTETNSDGSNAPGSDNGTDLY